MEPRGRYLFVVLLGLLGAASAVLLVEQGAQQHRGANAESFQRLVGGAGFGPATDLSGCAFSFDPRLDWACSAERGPVPGGSCFCPRHSGSLFFYRALPDNRPLLGEEGHAPPP